MTDPGAEMKARAREEFAELVGSEQFYQTQESAMAPGIADGWPEIIKAPHTKNGRLKKVKTQELFDRLAAFVAKEVARSEKSRRHTQDWYAAHYGKLEDWARKILPEPWVNQFFSCIANGTYDSVKDVGEPYLCNGGFMVTPGGYIKFDTAQEQILHDQSDRAEKAESAIARAVEEERMAIAKIACSYCRQDSAETQQYDETPVPKDGYLIHERKGWTNSGMSCGAKAIHERSQVKGEG